MNELHWAYIMAPVGAAFLAWFVIQGAELRQSATGLDEIKELLRGTRETQDHIAEEILRLQGTVVKLEAETKLMRRCIDELEKDKGKK